MPGVQVANVEQQDWFAGVATKVLLPRFKARASPSCMVFWSRDPDGTQHDQGDSLNSLTPGINGPTSMAAIRNASNDLQALRDTLKALGLDKTTDIVVTADHGFSTMSRQSATSAAAKLSYPRRARASCRPASWPSTWPRRWTCRCCDAERPRRRAGRRLPSEARRRCWAPTRRIRRSSSRRTAART